MERSEIGIRTPFHVARHERPFTIETIVILPDHLHAIRTLPPGDSDFPGHWKRIKA
jgi:putative transposase